MAEFIEWADPYVEVFEVYRVSVVRGCDEYGLVRGCFVCKLSPEHVARVKA